MSKQRDVFEAWWLKNNPGGWGGVCAKTAAWEAWQASRAAALEEAALAAEQYPNPCGHAPWAAHTVDMTCVEIGSAIRALKEQQ